MKATHDIKRIAVNAILAFCVMVMGFVIFPTHSHAAYKYSHAVKKLKKNDAVIYGELYKPKGIKGKMPLIIYSHGLGGTCESGRGYAEFFAKKGVAVYIFDFRGGGSGSKSDGDTTEMSVMTEVSDLEAVLKATRKWTFVNTKKITLLGGSQGGIVSAIVAARNEKKVAGLMLQFPAFSIHDTVHSLFSDLEKVPDTYNLLGYITLGHEYAEDVWDYDVYHEISSYKKPVLLQHGTMDLIVPYSYSQKALEVYEDATLLTLENAPHGFTGDYDKKARRSMHSYMKKNHLY